MFPQRQLQSDAGNVRVRRGEAFTIAASAASVGLNFDKRLALELKSDPHAFGWRAFEPGLVDPVREHGQSLGISDTPKMGLPSCEGQPPLQSTARLPLLLPSAAPRQLPPLER